MKIRKSRKKTFATLAPEVVSMLAGLKEKKSCLRHFLLPSTTFKLQKKYLALAFCLTYMVPPITESVKVTKRKPKRLSLIRIVNNKLGCFV